MNSALGKKPPVTTIKRFFAKERHYKKALLENSEVDKELSEEMQKYAQYVLDEQDRAFILAVSVRLSGKCKKARISAGQEKGDGK